MAQPKTNYIVDALLALAFLVTAITSMILFFLPSGVPQGGQREFLGITKHLWSEIHTWAGMVFILLVVIHFIMHWKWVVAMTKQIFKKK